MSRICLKLVTAVDKNTQTAVDKNKEVNPAGELDTIRINFLN